MASPCRRWTRAGYGDAMPPVVPPPPPSACPPIEARIHHRFAEADQSREHDVTLQELQTRDVLGVATLVGAHLAALQPDGVPLHRPRITPRVGLRRLSCWYLDPRWGSEMFDQLFGDYNSREEWAQLVVDAQGQLWQLSARPVCLSQVGRAARWNPAHRGHLSAGEALTLLLARVAELEGALASRQAVPASGSAHHPSRVRERPAADPERRDWTAASALAHPDLVGMTPPGIRVDAACAARTPLANPMTQPTTPSAPR
jgi:hypothetical protein